MSTIALGRARGAGRSYGRLMSRNPIWMYYLGRRLWLKGIPVLPRLPELALYVLCGARVPSEADIGPGCILAHGGSGVVIHPRARIGRDVSISQQVTVGGTGRRVGEPVIEDHVNLGAGCRVLGPIVVGAGTIVGANVVLTRSVPPNSIVAAAEPSVRVSEDGPAHLPR